MKLSRDFLLHLALDVMLIIAAGLEALRDAAGPHVAGWVSATIIIVQAAAKLLPPAEGPLITNGKIARWVGDALNLVLVLAYSQAAVRPGVMWLVVAIAAVKAMGKLIVGAGDAAAPPPPPA